jgi:hypothetical protein
MESTECSRSATTAALLASQKDLEGVQGTQQGRGAGSEIDFYTNTARQK